jgi:hypothetical protein
MSPRDALIVNYGLLGGGRRRLRKLPGAFVREMSLDYFYYNRMVLFGVVSRLLFSVALYSHESF